MIWFFERQQSRLHYEIRRQSDGDDYELVITWPDGRQEIERYPECGALVERSEVLQSRLTEEGWAPPPNGLRAGARSARSYGRLPVPPPDGGRRRIAPPKDSSSTSALPVPRT
jgi:hypothetical protein